MDTTNMTPLPSKRCGSESEPAPTSNSSPMDELPFASEPPAAIATGASGVTVKVWANSTADPLPCPPDVLSGSGCSDGSCGCDTEPMMIWDRSIPGQTSFFLINPHLPRNADPEEVAHKLLATMEVILSEMRADPSTGMLPDDTRRARARAEGRMICFYCHEAVLPGEEYLPLGGDGDDDPLIPDEPCHEGCRDAWVADLREQLQQRRASREG